MTKAERTLAVLRNERTGRAYDLLEILGPGLDFTGPANDKKMQTTYGKKRREGLIDLILNTMFREDIKP